MSEPGPPAFHGFPLEQRIAERGEACGIHLEPRAVSDLAAHARLVLASNAMLHLTTVVEPSEFLERHIGEALEGAALLPPAVAGTLLDMGSGNGYPALPVAAAHPALRLVLVEASGRKTAFLREVLASVNIGAPAEVLERQVQRASDLEPWTDVAVITCRGVGGWERFVPKLVPALGSGASVLLWAGDVVETVRCRVAWRTLELKERRALPGRDRSAVWRFERSG